MPNVKKIFVALMAIILTGPTEVQTQLNTGQRGTDWLEDLVLWWRTEIDSQFDNDDNYTDHTDYWYYREDSNDKCIQGIDESPLAKKPNILFVLADDWGYDDVGYHNRSRKTPFINWLARNGLRLEQSYATAWCTPSRASLMTGKYPHSIQRQRWVLGSESLTGLKLDEKLLPSYLIDQGYSTHMLGKWHLGFCNEAYLPTQRGFDTQYGFMNSEIRNYAKTDTLTPYVYEWFANDTIVTGPEEELLFSGDLLLTRATQIITQSAQSKIPFFVYLAPPHVHYPVEAPLEFTDMYQWEKDDTQRSHYAMISHLDAMVGSIVRTLVETDQYDNTIMIMMGDNGGYTTQWSWVDFRGTGSNFPFKGGKGNNLEGGTRVPTFIHSKLLKNIGVSNKMIHIIDWLPTLLSAIGIPKSNIEALNLDGIDQYDTIFRGCPSVRNDFIYAFQNNLLNIADYTGTSIYPTGAVRLGKYKISNINEPLDMPEYPYNGVLTPLLPAFQNFTIYDLSGDPTENDNLLGKLPPETFVDLVTKFFEFATQIGSEEPFAQTPYTLDTMTRLGTLRTDFCNLDGTRST